MERMVISEFIQFTRMFVRKRMQLSQLEFEIGSLNLTQRRYPLYIRGTKLTAPSITKWSAI